MSVKGRPPVMVTSKAALATRVLGIVLTEGQYTLEGLQPQERLGMDHGSAERARSMRLGWAALSPVEVFGASYFELKVASFFLQLTTEGHLECGEREIVG